MLPHTHYKRRSCRGLLRTPPAVPRCLLRGISPGLGRCVGRCVGPCVGQAVCRGRLAEATGFRERLLSLTLGLHV